MFNGFRTFIGGFAISDFFASYVTIPVVILCYLGWKFGKKTSLVPLDEIYLGGGPHEALEGTRYDSM